MDGNNTNSTPRDTGGYPQQPRSFPQQAFPQPGMSQGQQSPRGYQPQVPHGYGLPGNNTQQGHGQPDIPAHQGFGQPGQQSFPASQQNHGQMGQPSQPTYIPQRQAAQAQPSVTTSSAIVGGYRPQTRIMPDPEALAAAFAKNGYAGYLVVHREYTSTRFDPVMTIKNNCIAFNNTCIRKLDDVVYIQLLVNTIENKLVVRPCQEGAKDAIRWCVAKGDVRKTRQITCPDFTTKLYKLLSWNDVLRYRLQGTRITYQGDQIYIFDLSAHEAFSPTTVVDGKRKAGKRVLPEEWADSFGTPVEEHDAFTKIDLSQGYQGTDFDASSKSEEQEKEEYAQQVTMEEVKV